MRLPNGRETISVGDLRKALEGVGNDLPVEVFVETNYPLDECAHGFYVTQAKLHPESGISSKAFNIHLGKAFWL